MTNEITESAVELVHTTGLQVVIFDHSWRSWIGIVPWLSTLVVPGVILRSLFLVSHRRSERAVLSAHHCFLVLHIQFAFAIITGTWIWISGVWLTRQYMNSSAACLAMQNLNIAHLLWLVAYQCFIATIAAWIVMICSGCRPRLWQPGIAIISSIICGLAQLIARGVFLTMES